MKRRVASLIMAIVMAVALINVPMPAREASAAPVHEAMREKWKEMLTGGELDLSDPTVAAAAADLGQEAYALWEDMDTSAARTYLWSDKPNIGNSRQIRDVYIRLRTMSIAYSTEGAIAVDANSQPVTLYQNSALGTDIAEALHYMFETRYNGYRDIPPSSGTSSTWDWQLGIPVQLNDSMVLMYDLLSQETLDLYEGAIDRFTPAVTQTGANRAWRAVIIGIRGIVGEDDDKIAAARDGLSQIFDYVISGDGFYEDGTFIQHSNISYNGGYGLSLLEIVSQLLVVLHGSPWQVTDPDLANVWHWVYKAYQPFIYKGAMMDMVRGREISRDYEPDHAVGHQAIRGILRLSEIAPAADALAFKRMVKAWIQSDTYRDFLAHTPLSYLMLAKELLSDPLIAPADELILYNQYTGMDRAVQLRPGYGLGLAMFSSRIGSHESINSENNRGWYTGAGTLYLYNSDLGHYSGEYWPTVDSRRLPGTTVLSQTDNNQPNNVPKTSTKNWVGGASLLGTYGVSGYDLEYRLKSLGAKKSYFMFDDEIVALGAGITSMDGIPVETIVENRKLSGAGTNTFTVNGATELTSFVYSTAAEINEAGNGDWSIPSPPSPETIAGAQWAHLAGSVPGSDIGYYFPEATDLKAVRNTREGSWNKIRGGSPNTVFVRHYLTMWLDHGANPTNADYQYAILPNKSSSQVSSYASNPNFEVLENTTSIQAVKETTLGIVGANFWQDGENTVDLIKVNKKASVMTKETGNALDVSVSDPTQSNFGAIEVELDRTAISYTADPGITVTRLSPTIRFTVNTNLARGKSFEVQFTDVEPGGGLGGDPDPEPIIKIVDNADTSGVTKIGSWVTASTETDRYGPNYLHDNNADKGDKSVTFTPDLPVAGTYEVSIMYADHFNRADNVPVTVTYDGGTDQQDIDQTSGGGIWHLLGEYEFESGTSGSVTVSNLGTTKHVVADAVRFVFIPDPPAPDPVIIDNLDLGSTPAGWVLSSNTTDRYGPNYFHDNFSGQGSKSVTLSKNLPLPGTYKVSMMWSRHENRATNVPVEITHANGIAQLSVNQRQAGTGGIWNELGTYEFDTIGSVTIRNDNANGYVVADAVMFEYIPR